jgi:ATP/maltotriose-dependent transcriptional regulator MalT
VTVRASHRLVVRSKLLPAQVPDGLVTRTRLAERLTSDARFTLVSAMPGFGKTVAVRQWIDTLDVPVAWLSLDLLDSDPTSFWSHFLLAVGSVLPGVDEEPAMLLAERGADDVLFLAALLRELEETSGHVVLVLDGLAELDAATLDGVALLVDRAGDRLRLVVTARSTPPLPLARWRSMGWLTELGADDLRLTDDEARELAQRLDAKSIALATDDVAVLNRRVDGWPIGLHLALLSDQAIDGESLSRSARTARSERMLAGYLVADVLDSMSEDDREVALALSVVEWFDPDICMELVGPHADASVRRFIDRGMFLTVIDRRVGMMRFHALFRELLEVELSWRDPARRIDLHRRAAMVWRSRGDLTSAYRHLSAVGETARAHEVLVNPALDLVDRGDLAALHQFAQQLPAPRDVDDANLALDLGLVAFYAEGTLASRRWCDRAEILIGTAEVEDGERDDLVVRLHHLRTGIALLEADLDTAIDGIAVLREHSLGSRPLPVFEQRFPILAARIMLAARRIDDADQWIRRAEQITGPDILTSVTVPTLRAWHEWIFGRLDVATRQIDSALLWMDEHRVGAHHLAFDTLITGGWCRLSAGDLADAALLARRARDDADALGCAWNHLQAGYLSARLDLVTGNPSGALRTVDDLRSRVPFENCRPYADRILGVEVEALAASGQRDRALREIDELFPNPRTQLLRARFAASRIDDVEALLADRTGWPMVERLQAELVLCAANSRTVPSTELVELVRECADTGWVLPFLGLGGRVDRLLQSIALADMHPALARTLAFVSPVSASPGRSDGMRLTSRELTLLELLPTHLSYAEMGERLYLSVNTVKTNLKHLYRKLGASTRTEAVQAAERSGLL